MYEDACEVYKRLASQGVISIFVSYKEQLQLIENSGYDLRYVFLYDGVDIPTPEEAFSIYHLHDITNPHHYWVDVDVNYEGIIDFFNKVEQPN